MRRRLCWLVLLSLLLVGCWDRHEVNDVAFVAANAIDLEDDQYRLTVTIPVPGGGGGGTGGGGGGGGGGTGGAAGKMSFYVDSATGRTVREAEVRLQTAVSRELVFGHRRIAVISEDAARVGVGDALEVLTRMPQNRLTAYVVVARGRAGDVLSVDAPVEQSAAEMAREMAAAVMHDPPTMRRFLDFLLTPGIDPMVPALTTTMSQPGQGQQPRSTVMNAGVGVFRKRHLVAILDGRDARGALWAAGQAKTPTIFFGVPAGSGRIGVQFVETRARVHPMLKGNQLTMRIEVRATGIVVENASNYPLSVRDHLAQFSEHAASQIADDIQVAMHRLQELGSDPVGFGMIVRRAYPAYWQRVENDWRRYYKEVQVVVEPYVMIEHTGMLLEPVGRARPEQK